MVPLGLTVPRLSRELHVPAGRLSAVIAGRRPITADLALRLGRYFGMNPETWLALQAAYELQIAERQNGRQIEQLIAPLEAA